MIDQPKFRDLPVAPWAINWALENSFLRLKWASTSLTRVGTPKSWYSCLKKPLEISGSLLVLDYRSMLTAPTIPREKSLTYVTCVLSNQYLVVPEYHMLSSQFLIFLLLFYELFLQYVLYGCRQMPYWTHIFRTKIKCNQQQLLFFDSLSL